MKCSEEPEFEVADSDMPQDQEENPRNDDVEPKGKVASKRDWFTKPKRHKEPTDPDWNKGKTPQQGPNQSWLMTFASFADKQSKTFDELMSTPIDFSAYIMNGLKITNLTQETLLVSAHIQTTQRHTLMRSGELYQFSDGTLTRLQTSLDDITKNIRIEYLLQRRWGSLEKKKS
ncbi:hypothetical protein Tco_0606195 [Tanacetum coccineum]